MKTNTISLFKSKFELLSRRFYFPETFHSLITIYITQFCFPNDMISEKIHSESVSKFDEKEKKIINELFPIILQCYQENIEKSPYGWHDFLGEFYESNIQSKMKASILGQFFTPSSLCDLMTMIAGKSTNSFINDPCSGSGRNILSHHAQNPGNTYVADDIDLVSVKMTVFNCLIHGVKATILWHNTLSEPHFAKYKFIVNAHLGEIPLPHYLLEENVGEEEIVKIKNSQFSLHF